MHGIELYEQTLQFIHIIILQTDPNLYNNHN